MLALAVLDPRSPLPRQISWALCFASARAADLEIVLPLGGSGPPRTIAARDAGSEAGAVARAIASLRQAVADTPGFRVADDGSDTGAAAGTDTDQSVEAADDAPAPRQVDLVALRAQSHSGGLLRRANERNAALIVLLHGEGDLKETLQRDAYRDVLQRAPCAVVLLHLGAGEEGHGPDVLVATTRDPLSRTILRLGRDLAATAGGRLTATFVEPRIGADAEPVGQKVIDDLLRAAFGKDRTADVEGSEPPSPLVVVDDRPENGILRACETVKPGLLIVGVARFALLGGRFFGNIAGRVVRKRPGLDVAIVRDALPFTNRLRQVAEEALRRIVPQLERDQRIGFAEHVQSSSAWNFDFVALISLSALIAAMGLIQDSAAVVIGAMLIAPLMTPILGVGLALVHGNAALARLASRSIAYGVVTAFLLGMLIGLVDPVFVRASDQMMARGSPGMLDLVVAFVSGLAAAYATSRPGLVAALPGVAIAASLVPPLATSGLFASLGELRLAGGAFLLFLTNMVAIVLASSVSLWAVGIRSVKGGSRATRTVGNTLIAVTLLLAAYLSLPRGLGSTGSGVPAACATALKAHLAPSFRLHSHELIGHGAGRELVLRIAGDESPGDGLAGELRDLARRHFPEPIAVRLIAEWEAIAMPPGTEGR